MDREGLLRQLGETPVIAAIKSGDQLGKALESECRVVFVLSSDIMTVGEMVERVKERGKTVFVHIDLVYGLAAKEVAVDFIRRTTRADGVISTRPPLVRYARQQGLMTVQRFFLLDSIALENTRKQVEQDCADLVEVLPGVMPKLIRQLAFSARNPVIAGGLIVDKEDVMGALGAGATAVSTTNTGVWFL